MRLIPNRWQALAAFAVAAILLGLFDTFVMESVVVPSASMEPTLLPNERLLLQKWPRREIHRFDIVVVWSRAMNKRLVKRVIGLPHDTIRIEDGWRLRLNGEPLMYATTADTNIWIEAADHSIQVKPLAGNNLPPIQSITLGDDQYFLMGDNRLASEDSRQIGAVNSSDIEGTVLAIWYSFDLKEHRLRWDRLFRACH